ncbi:MAG: right-handed parallel beta-helix repeat-containing protein [Bacteroidota bacterium]
MRVCYRPLVVLVSILLIQLLSSSSFAQVSGLVTSDTTWIGGTVTVSGTVTIQAGVTLTISPGVSVEFAPGTSMIVTGALIADGDLGSEIVFTSGAGSPAPGDWNGIVFANNTPNGVGSVFDYCIVEYAGGGANQSSVFYSTGAFAIPISHSTFRYSSNQGINARASSPLIKNSTFYENTGYAIFSDLASNFVVDSCTIYNNTGGGIRISVNSTAQVTNSTIDTNGTAIFVDNSAYPTIQNNIIRENNVGVHFTAVGASQPNIKFNIFSDNVTWAFQNVGSTTVLAELNYWGRDSGPYHASLNPTGLGDKVTDRVDFQPWSTQGLPLPVRQITAGIGVPTTWYADTVYRVTTSITVSSTLTLEPGTIVKFGPSIRMTVTGSLIANGVSDSLIVFTSDRDDPFGGDSNGDGATGAAPGNWDVVYLNAGGNNSTSLSYCLFRFGGSSSQGNIRIHSASPSVSNITSTQSLNYGLWLTSGANVQISGSYFGANADDGVLIYGSNPTFYGSSFVGNARYGIFSNSGTTNFSVRKSTFTGNSHGIVADQGSAGVTLTSLDSSNISNNINGGVYLAYQTGNQTISFNRVANNGAYGIWCFNTNGIVTLEGDTVLDNGQEGIVTSKAVLLNNVLQGNRYPIGHTGRMGSTYSGNTVSGNDYNNVVALRINISASSFSDTLRAATPAGFAPATYVLLDNSAGWGVEPGKTFVIEPGVIIKMASGQYFRVDGTLIADGTPADPIVFTSYRDNSYGGNTNLSTDTNPPAPGNWKYVRIRPGGGASASVLDNVIFAYGGTDNNGNLWIEGGNSSLSNPVTNIVSRRSSSMGIYVSNVLLTIDGATIDSNATYGMYIDGSSTRADVTLRNAFVRYNGNIGLRATDNSTFREVSISIVQGNNGSGIHVTNGTVPMQFVGNTISQNNGHGIYVNSGSIGYSQLQFIGNTVSNNTADGIFSSAATFVDNDIIGNRYPIGVTGRLGNRYTDSGGSDGNTITGNTFNNAIAIAGGSGVQLRDTLKNVFPQAITSNSYIAIQDLYVDNGTTLVIQPGVNIKFDGSTTWYRFEVNGTLIAEGAPGSPIIFTSWRDSTVGGKTIAPNTYGAPAPGNWYWIAFRAGSSASSVKHTQFKYGGRNGDATVHFYGPITFSNNLVRKSYSSGIIVQNTAQIIDSTTVDSSSTNGIRVYDYAGANVSVLNSNISYNGSHGLLAEGTNGKFSTVSNSTITYNGNTGIIVSNNTIPLSIIGNTVSNNADHGMYIVARNDAVDSLLIIAGNKVRDNGNTGIFSSRALIVDDSVSGNRYGIGIVGQLSLDLTTTAAGNVYIGNVIEDNTFNDILVAQEAAFGYLGGSFPPGYSGVVSVRGGLLVPSGTTMTIKPGTVIKFANEYSGGVAGSQGRFRVDGVLKSKGTLNEKIVFTSWRDDSYGGDSNADSNATVPGPGNWDMIYLVGANNNSSHILHTIVRYGGYSGNGNIRLDNNTAPIDSSFSSYSNYYGIYLVNSSPSVFANEIHHNNYGLYLTGSSNPVINYNNISDNSTYGMYQGTSNTINATNNYWGHASGPLVNQGAVLNLNGLGNRIYIASGAVNYMPYLTTRSGILLGDVSENGSISAFDGALVLRHNVQLDTLTTAQLLAADVSGNGDVTAYDASLILQYVVGRITGFPGLGKSAGAGALATSYEWQLRNGESAGEIELVLRLRGTAKIFAAQLQISFDASELTPVDVRKTSLSDAMTVQSHLKTEQISVAMAGVDAVETEGDLVRLVFRSARPIADLASSSIRFTGFQLNEAELATGLEATAQIPTVFGLDQNYPNPFNPETTIRFQLPMPSSVTIAVYDMLGREVRSLVSGQQDAGYHSVLWDGRTNAGQQAASGVYFYRIHALGSGSEFTTVKRMLLVR